jgi:hypothetical protein
MTYFLAELNKANEAISRVRELHQQDGDYCAVCERRGGGYSSGQRIPYPCPTIEALNGDTVTLERDDDHDSRREYFQDEDLG